MVKSLRESLKFNARPQSQEAPVEKKPRFTPSEQETEEISWLRTISEKLDQLISQGSSQSFQSHADAEKSKRKADIAKRRRILEFRPETTKHGYKWGLD